MRLYDGWLYVLEYRAIVVALAAIDEVDLLDILVAIPNRFSLAACGEYVVKL